ncbi:protein RIK [Iris pallida]|uniref:Protein RIK n=1 Tax=Iris pallida TaxID=29817 RepID=A0AAX6H541_IRIPA|nr:protein RIK [Iris pallida]
MTEDRIPKPSEEPTTAGRQRKKRKWDQPAESLIAAGVSINGAYALGMGGIAGVPFPGTVPLSTALITNQLPGNSATASLMFQSTSVSQNAASLVQKLNQPKIQDELIAREIIINDAEPTVRYKLTKRQTQEEIQKSTGAIVITRGKYRPPNGLPDNERPLYLHISAGAHLKDTAERIKAVDRAASMVEEILKQGQFPLSASNPLPSAITNGQATQPMSTCLFLGFETDPSINIAARIRGPNDQYINHIMNETGATVVLRGRGSGNLEDSSTEEAQKGLHLYLSSTNQKSLEAASILAENLLDTICTECCASRMSSCKVYSAVPPPQQLLTGVHTSGLQGVNANASPVTGAESTSSTLSTAPNMVPLSASTNVCPLGSMLYAGSLPIYGNPQPAVSFSYPSVAGGTCYTGYGGIYPQATPLQQVALALRKTPAPTTSVSATITSVSSSNPSLNTTPNSNSNSLVKTVIQPPQKRKFQELPASTKGQMTHHQNLLQGSECLKPGLKDSVMRSISSMPPPKKLLQPEFVVVVPPKNMPPPPPKFTATKSPGEIENNLPLTKKSDEEPVSDTLLKLVEYGEEDEDIDNVGEEAIDSNLAQNPAPKPFWAV